MKKLIGTILYGDIQINPHLLAKEIPGFPGIPYNEMSTEQLMRCACASAILEWLNSLDDWGILGDCSCTEQRLVRKLVI